MPNPKEMSGNVLPVNDIPAGTVTVRVVRGAFKNIPDQPVDFLIAGKKRTVVDRRERPRRSQRPALAARS